MRFTRTNRPASGFNLLELLVVIGTIALLAALLLPPSASKKRRPALIDCASNLKQVGIAFQLWAQDNGDRYPMQFALTNSETLKLVTNGSAYLLWQTMSNELSTPKILYCPDDQLRTNARSFSQNFSDANISYFLSLDATESYPQMILEGDDHLAVNGVRAKPGILILETNRTVAWTQERHKGVGNIGTVDGSVLPVPSTNLNAAIVSGVSTNVAPRWIIP